MNSRALSGLACLCCAGALACARPGAEAVGSTPELLPTTQVEAVGDSIRLMLQVTNTTDEPVVLEFSSGQSFDFVVTRDGSTVWRWSDDRMFTQALRQETVPPGATLTYDAVWSPPPRAAGQYRVTGILTAQGHRVEQSADFVVD